VDNVFFLTLDDPIVNNYPQLWPGSTFENTYADSANLNDMINFNNIQVELFNNGSTNSDALFKISWTLTPQVDTILESELPDKPQTLLELANIADAEMNSWTTTKFNQNLRIGNIFLYDNYPNASVEQIINALY